MLPSRCDMIADIWSRTGIADEKHGKKQEQKKEENKKNGEILIVQSCSDTCIERVVT